MATDTDRSKREQELRREQEKRAKADRKQQNREAKAQAKETSFARKVRNRNTTAHKESSNSIRFMFLSSIILLVIFFVFELLLFVLTDKGWGALDTHLANMADNTLAFVIGLGAMDAVTYFNQVGRSKRNEIRAIIRHNRLLEPNIDMFVARKNAMTTPADEPVDQYTIRRDAPLIGFAGMFEPSSFSSDAGMSKLDMYAYHQKYLFKSFQKMIEEIDFSFSPEACDAAMEFINATAYGSSSLQALVALQADDMKTKRNAVIKAIKEEATKPSESETRPELMSVMILKQTIRDQEEALERYLDAVKNIGSD